MGDVVAIPKRRAENAAYYASRREELKARARSQGKVRRTRLRAEVLAAYGDVCACCGEGQQEFLCIDHIDGGGVKHRRELGKRGHAFHAWLKQNGFPKGFRILCHNCNQARGAFGYCPHEVQAKEEAV